MEVSDYEVGVVKLSVERCRCQHDACQPRCKELKEEANRELHRGRKVNLTTPEGREPVEDLDPGRYGNNHRREEKRLFAPGPRPTVNIWCAQTLRLTKPIPTDAATIAG